METMRIPRGPAIIECVLTTACARAQAQPRVAFLQTTLHATSNYGE